MKIAKPPLIIRIIVFISASMANVIAGLHCLCVSLSILTIPECIGLAPTGKFKTLQEIWMTRLLRKFISGLLRTKFNSAVLNFINFPEPSNQLGCIITSCHSPWTRLLVQWCKKKKFALLISSGAWLKRVREVNHAGRGFRDLRNIVKHLQNGGKVIIAADVFSDSKGCIVNFFEHEHYASLTPLRLARIANVPLITVIPEMKNNFIEIKEKMRFEKEAIISNPQIVLQKILSFIEQEIRVSPSIWFSFTRESLWKKTRVHEQRTVKRSVETLEAIP